MKSILFPSIAIVALLSAVAVADDLESGLKVGEKAGAYHVKDCTGPSAGKSLCYRCQYGDSQVMNVFTRSLSDDLASLVKQMDEKIGDDESGKMKGFLVLLTDDPDQAEEDLKAFAKEHEIKNMPLTYFDGVAGPKNYNIAEEADLTVNMWAKSTCKVNHALAKDDLDEDAVEKIVESISELTSDE